MTVYTQHSSCKEEPGYCLNIYGNYEFMTTDMHKMETMVTEEEEEEEFVVHFQKLESDKT
jgi:hypothetical protein